MLGKPESPAQLVAILKKGYWEETAIYRQADGTEIVRKASHPVDDPGPWALQTLRREIRYLKTLPPAAHNLFPPLRSAWGDADIDTSDVGYEIPYYGDHVSVAEKIRRKDIPSQARSLFQHALAEQLFKQLHTPAEPEFSLAQHVAATLREVTDKLAEIPHFKPVVADTLNLNDTVSPGLQALVDEIETSRIADALDQGPQVRLHGDLILENILCASVTPRWWDRFRFIDPVSVAGVWGGTPLFDLVKYQSYASGELLAIRSGLCEAGPTGLDTYSFAWDHRPETLSPYQDQAWTAVFTEAYVTHYGPIPWKLYHLLDAYFSLVMALNTSGKQQWARVLKGILALRLTVS